MARKISDSSEGRSVGTIGGVGSPDGKVVVWVAVGGEELTMVRGPQKTTDLQGEEFEGNIFITFNLLNVAYIVINTKCGSKEGYCIVS